MSKLTKVPYFDHVTKTDSREFQKHSINQRKKSLDDMHTQLKKYLNRMPAVLVITWFDHQLSTILTILAIHNPSSSRGPYLPFKFNCL